jgi:hypothetical protein
MGKDGEGLLVGKAGAGSLGNSAGCEAGARLGSHGLSRSLTAISLGLDAGAATAGAQASGIQLSAADNGVAGTLAPLLRSPPPFVCALPALLRSVPPLLDSLSQSLGFPSRAVLEDAPFFLAGSACARIERNDASSKGATSHLYPASPMGRGYPPGLVSCAGSL